MRASETSSSRPKNTSAWSIVGSHIRPCLSVMKFFPHELLNQLLLLNQVLLIPIRVPSPIDTRDRHPATTAAPAETPASTRE
jgi:hypothetical protein